MVKKGKDEMGQIEAGTAEHQKSVKKAETILEGAMQEFLAHGYAATSMDRVAVAAKVSKATVYSYFQDKEGLFTALIQRLARERFRTRLNPQNPQFLEGEPRIVLRRLATEILDNTIGDSQFQDFIRIVVGESGRFPELARAYVHNIAKPIVEILGQYLASNSQLKLPDPEATVRVFMGTLAYFVIFQELLHGKEILPIEQARLIDTLIDLIVPEHF